MSCIVFVHRISFANFFGCVLSLVQGHRAGASQVADKQDLRGQTVYFFFSWNHTFSSPFKCNSMAEHVGFKHMDEWDILRYLDMSPGGKVFWGEVQSQKFIRTQTWKDRGSSKQRQRHGESERQAGATSSYRLALMVTAIPQHTRYISVYLGVLSLLTPPQTPWLLCHDVCGASEWSRSCK